MQVECSLAFKQTDDELVSIYVIFPLFYLE